MTTRILTGTYSAGYTLSAGYTGLSITASGVVHGVGGAAGVNGGSAGGVGGAAGTGVFIGFSAPVINNGAIVGGVGGVGGNATQYGGVGGAGGTGLVLSAGGSVSNTNTIAGGTGGAGGDGVYGGAGGIGGAGMILMAGGSVINIGAITGGVGGAGQLAAADGARGNGVVLAAGGSVVNGSATATTALIGGYVGVYAGPSGAATVTNFGTLTGRRVAVQFKSAADRLIAEAGSTFIGLAQGGGGTLELAGGIGTITGLGDRGTLSGAEALTFKGFGSYAIDAGASWTLAGTNALTARQSLSHDGTLSLAGTLTNGGVIAGGAGGAGLSLAPGGVLVNRATIKGLVGVRAGGSGAATVTNFSFIEGTGGVAVQFKSVADRLIAEAGSVLIGAATGGGGTLELAGGTGTITGLGAAGTISGGVSMTFNGFGAYAIDTGTWTLTGTNTLAAGQSLTVAGSLFVADAATLAVQGAVVNSGLIALEAVTHQAILSIGAAGATFSGGGTVRLGNSARDQITGSGVLTNFNDTIFGAGLIGGGGLTLVNGALGHIFAFYAGGLTLDTGANTIANAGLIEADNKVETTIASPVNNTGTLRVVGGGVLIVKGAVTGTGAAVIGSGIIEFMSSFSETVEFVDKNSELELAQSQTYAGQVSGFSKTGNNQKLDLVDIGFVGSSEATFSGTTASGVLTVTDGAHTAHIHLTGNYTGLTFTASSDGQGGTIVTAGRAAAAAHHFIAAAASLGGSAGAAIHTGRAWTVREPMLLKPRTMIA